MSKSKQVQDASLLAPQEITSSGGSNAKKIRRKSSIIIRQEEEFTEGLKTKVGSMQTIFAITNSMVGSVCLVIPLVFLKSGIITCTLILIFLGFIQYKTCQIIIIHQRDDEKDVEAIIERLLGKNWVPIQFIQQSILFRLSSGILLFLIGVIYFLLINTTLYPILEFIFQKVDFTNYAQKQSDPVWDKFSTQYLSLCLIIPLAIPQFLDNIKLLLKLAEYGIMAIMSFGLFIFYIFFEALATGRLHDHRKDIVLFSFDFSQCAGQLAMAFMIHNFIGTITNCNRNPQNNPRDLAIAYSLAGFVYGFVGLFGSLGILGLGGGESPQTILDYFQPNDVKVIIIECLFLLHLFSAFPLFNFISRSQILRAFYGEQEVDKIVFYGYTVFYLGCCLCAQLFNFSIGKIIAFDGAVCGFLIIYIVPIGMHLTCYYKEEEGEKCVSHDGKDWISKPLRFTGYGIFVLVGLYNVYIQLRDFF